MRFAAGPGRAQGRRPGGPVQRPSTCPRGPRGGGAVIHSPHELRGRPLSRPVKIGRAANARSVREGVDTPPSATRPGGGTAAGGRALCAAACGTGETRAQARALTAAAARGGWVPTSPGPRGGAELPDSARSASAARPDGPSRQGGR